MDEQGVLSCFKAYDIRGRVPEELDTGLCAALGQALAAQLDLGGGVVLGRDVRPSGVELASALSDSLRDAGVDVTDIGICGTEEIYFATARHGFSLGVMLTASHNPPEYNGLKMVLADAAPLSADSGLFALRDRILRRDFQTAKAGRKGRLHHTSYRDEYVDFLLSCQDERAREHPLKIVMNPGNGCADLVLDELLPQLCGDFVLVNSQPDGGFPSGVPNPLLPERRADTANAVRKSGADLGLAWDGDFDRCFFYGADAKFIESYYLIGLFARKILRQCPGGRIIHDTRLMWNTIEQVRQAGGIPLEGKTGHAFMKERMRRAGAVYGGEMSAHHYFKDFHCCDSGMLPWILLLNILAEERKPLDVLVAERIKAYPCSGEINFTLAEQQPADEIRSSVQTRFAGEIKNFNYIDGLSADCGAWRFNLRSSNTEPLLRLNVEARGDVNLLRDKTAAISELITTNSGG
ncbi:MAG: phosphomannomutase [Deltaproteobacteria bacterium]|jgi:phosphomannomutase|nr:phosphomannomutase [Deltaproteobacteria bacterium]